MALLLTLLVTASVALGAWIVVRDWAFPPFILGSVWTLTLLVYLIEEDRLYALSALAGSVIALGILCFTLGASIALSRIPRTATHTTSIASQPRSSGAWIFWVALAGLPFFVARAWALATSGPTDTLAVNLRLAVSAADSNNESFGALAYFLPFSVFGTALHALGLVRATAWRLRGLSLLSAIYALASSGRTSFLLLLTVVGGGMAISGRMPVRRLILVGGGAFLAVFGLFAYAMNKGISGSSDIAPQFAEILSQYLLGGTAGLNDFLRQPAPLEWGVHTFRTFVAIAHALGMAPPPVSLVQEFRRVPFETNVFSVFRPYYADFGWAGVIGSQFLFGVAHGSLYAKARSGRPVYAFLYGLLLYPLIMQVFQDQYMTLLSTWMQAAALLVVTTVRVRLRD